MQRLCGQRELLTTGSDRTLWQLYRQREGDVKQQSVRRGYFCLGRGTGLASRSGFLASAAPTELGGFLPRAWFRTCVLASSIVATAAINCTGRPVSKTASRLSLGRKIPLSDNARIGSWGLAA